MGFLCELLTSLQSIYKETTRWSAHQFWQEFQKSFWQRRNYP